MDKEAEYDSLCWDIPDGEHQARVWEMLGGSLQYGSTPTVRGFQITTVAIPGHVVGKSSCCRRIASDHPRDKPSRCKVRESYRAITV